MRHPLYDDVISTVSSSPTLFCNANRVLEKRQASAARGATPASPAQVLLERDAFVCSELERAAHCLASVEAALADLLRQCGEAADRQRRESGWEESKEGERVPLHVCTSHCGSLTSLGCLL